MKTIDTNSKHYRFMKWYQDMQRTIFKDYTIYRSTVHIKTTCQYWFQSIIKPTLDIGISAFLILSLIASSILFASETIIILKIVFTLLLMFCAIMLTGVILAAIGALIQFSFRWVFYNYIGKSEEEEKTDKEKEDSMFFCEFVEFKKGEDK